MGKYSFVSPPPPSKRQTAEYSHLAFLNDPCFVGMSLAWIFFLPGLLKDY